MKDSVQKVCEIYGEPVYEIEHIETDSSGNYNGTSLIYCCTDEVDYLSPMDNSKYHCGHQSYTYKIKGEDDVSPS